MKFFNRHRHEIESVLENSSTEISFTAVGEFSEMSDLTHSDEKDYFVGEFNIEMSLKHVRIF